VRDEPPRAGLAARDPTVGRAHEEPVDASLASGARFAERGAVTLPVDGAPMQWRLFAVESAEPFDT
jgi:hypothetical protein